MQTNKSFRILIALLTSATFTFAQNDNQAAVDTLTKEVAKAVFANIAKNNQPKAQEIYTKLVECSADCDPQLIIKTVGSWDQVGAKMQELSELKNTQQFLSMSPSDANAAIRKQLKRFYTAHKAEKPYSVPLSPDVQTQILAKIDELLPPGDVVAPDSVASSSAPAATQPVSDEETNDNSALAPSGQRGTSDDKLFWMILAGFIAGLLGGAAAVYFLLYKETKAEADQLRFDNSKLSRSLDAAQRVKPANVPRQPQDTDQQKVKAYESLLAELGTDADPVEAIRQLKQQTPVQPPEPTPVTRSGQPTIESEATLEAALVEPLAPLPPLPPLEPLPQRNRSEVFYFPPPDPNGQFDMAQKTDTLSPESAYRFSVSADDPSIATFRFEADPGRVARFLTYRNYMIEPACESENSYTNSYTRIAMRKDGQALFENGAWRVKTKALIRYE
ncbi:hypothetical protein [Spirosoma validum]|uniref:Uncharacterized protein n=1 Tax=Spirosoma validum TaxID=2771355 RepID=A0A927B609_9BACT|nr:hypothetical protein [Spirosoma validum]MBD2755968.1 hypothetical protein [Spirosoma validum]